jgi:phospholipid transport system substrate-binding protein
VNRYLSTLIGALLAALCLTPGWSWAGAAEDVIRDTTQRVLAELQAQREAIRQNPELAYRLVDEELLARFNFAAMTQLAVGKYWRQADAAQQSQLTESFRDLLIRTYAKALGNYSDEKVEFLPEKPSRKENQATVQMRILSREGPPIPIDYRMRKEQQDWKIYDVYVDGISLVSNYRTQFASIIRKSGVDGLISDLRQLNGQI